MLNHLTDADVTRLANSADQEINDCIRKVAVGRTRLGEVRAVEAVVRLGMRMVARKWRRAGLFSPPNLALQTIFTHAAPKVSFVRPDGTDGFCELADLLIVIDDPHSKLLFERRRAVLIQAKLYDPPGQIKLNSGNERVQFELLSAWPDFKFETALYRCHARDFKLGPPDASWSGEYGGIEQPPSGDWTQYHVHNAPFNRSPPIGGAVSLGTLLAGMLAGRPEYGRPAIPLGRDPWSETVDELLDVTFSLPLRGRQPRSKRGRAHLLAFTNLNETTDGRLPPTSVAGDAPPLEYPGEEEWPNGAVSIVRFVIGETVEG
jgi:hypothetical protein